jgi:hypothetical protein
MSGTVPVLANLPPRQGGSREGMRPTGNERGPLASHPFVGLLIGLEMETRVNASTKDNFGQSLVLQSSPSATRRSLMITLPLAAATTDVLWLARRPESAVAGPTGKGAALLAARVTAASWQEAKSWAHGMLNHWMWNDLSRQLVSYAAIHSARFGTEPCAAHMLIVADVISLPPRGPYPGNRWSVWGDDQRKGLDPSKFGSVWQRARLIELERSKSQLARIRVAVAAV